MKQETFAPAYKLTDEEIQLIVQNEMPGWEKACAHSDTDFVTFNQLAFSNTTEELLLMAIAVKYAKQKGKAVMISS